MISATDFKARCLELLDKLASREIERIDVTKRGRVVATLRPPESTTETVQGLFGSMKGSVQAPQDFDWTAPVLDEPWIEEDGHD